MKLDVVLKKDMSSFFGSKVLAGVTSLVLLIAPTQPNLAMYIALTKQFGRSSQLSLTPFFSSMETPLVVLTVLAASGMVQVSFPNVIDTILPFLFGGLTGYVFLKKERVYQRSSHLLFHFLLFQQDPTSL